MVYRSVSPSVSRGVLLLSLSNESVTPCVCLVLLAVNHPISLFLSLIHVLYTHFHSFALLSAKFCSPTFLIVLFLIYVRYNEWNATFFLHMTNITISIPSFTSLPFSSTSLLLPFSASFFPPPPYIFSHIKLSSSPLPIPSFFLFPFSLSLASVSPILFHSTSDFPLHTFPRPLGK